MCCTGKHQGTITWGAKKWTNDNSLKYVIIIFCNILFVLLIWEAKAQIFRTKQKTARKWQSRAWSIISCLPLSHTAVTTPAFPQKQAGNLSVCWFNTAWFFGGKPQTWLLWEAAICFHCVRQTQSLMAREQTFQPEKGLQHLGCSLDLSLLHCLGCLLQTICQCFSAWKGLNIKSTSWGFATSFHLFFYFLKDRDRLSGSGSTSQQSPWPRSAAQIAHLQRDTQICCAGSLLEVGMNISWQGEDASAAWCKCGFALCCKGTKENRP